MNEKKITHDNEFNELKDLLKGLPKVNAPDNFEFNLMTKIQNKNFEVKSEKKKHWLSWSLTPAIAFATSVFLVFFIFSGEEDGDNPWNTLPQLMEKSITEVETSSINKEQFEKLPLNKKNAKISNPQNLVVSNSIKKDYPFEKNSSINFDEYLQSDVHQSPDVAAQLAGSQNSQASPFDGFFLRQRRNVQERDSIKKDKDSLQHHEIIKTNK